MEARPPPAGDDARASFPYFINADVSFEPRSDVDARAAVEATASNAGTRVDAAPPERARSPAGTSWAAAAAVETRRLGAKRQRVTRADGTRTPAPPPRPDAEARRAADPSRARDDDGNDRPRPHPDDDAGGGGPPANRPPPRRAKRPSGARTYRAGADEFALTVLRWSVPNLRPNDPSAVGLPPPGPAPTAFSDPDAYFATQKAIALEETRAALAAAMNNPNDPPPRFALDLTLAPSRAEGRAPPAGLHEADATEENGGFRRGASSSSSAAAAPRRRRASFGGTGPDDPDDRFSADWRRPGTVLALRPRGATNAVPVLALVAGSSAVAERREAGEPRGPCRLWTAKPLVDAGGRRHYYSAEILDGVVAHQRAYGSAHAAPKVPFLQALIGAKSATHVRFDDPEDGSSEDGGSEGTARDHVEGSGPAAAAASSSSASTASNVDRHAIDPRVFSEEDAAQRPSPPDASRVGATSRKGRQGRRVSKKGSGGGGGGGGLGVIRADSDGGLSRYLLMRREAAKAGGVKALEKLAGLNAAQLRAAGAFLGAASEDFSAADASGNNSDSVDPGSGGGFARPRGIYVGEDGGYYSDDPPSDLDESYFWDEEEEEEEEEEEDVEGGDHLEGDDDDAGKGSRERAGGKPPARRRSPAGALQLVQGPPGCGKTRFVVALLDALAHAADAYEAGEARSEEEALHPAGDLELDGGKKRKRSRNNGDSLASGRRREALRRTMVCAPSNKAVMVVLERYAASAEARNDDARVAEVEAAPGDPRLWTTPTPPALAGAEDALDAAANNTTEPFSDDEDAMRFFVYRRCEFLAARIERESRAGLDSARASSRHHHHHQHHQHHHGALKKRAATLFRAVALALWELAATAPAFLGGVGDGRLEGDLRVALRLAREARDRSPTAAALASACRAALATIDRIREGSSSKGKKGSSSKKGGDGGVTTTPFASAYAAEAASRASVVFCTLACAGQAAMARTPAPDALIVDEAAQALECELMCAFARRPRRCLLVGDPAQLPATMASEPARRAGHDRPLMRRLMDLGAADDGSNRGGENAFEWFTMLNAQYRMHPAIASFPSRRFYGGKVGDDPSVSRRGELVGRRTNDADSDADSDSAAPLPGWIAAPFVFVDVASGREERARRGASVANEAEASLAAAVAAFAPRALAVRAPPPSSGGSSSSSPLSCVVLAFYAEQVRRVKARLATLGRSRPFFTPRERAAFEDAAYTVDGFQGSEADVVVVSATRSNARGNVGFLADERRLNVALTRAKRLCVVLGDARTLERCESEHVRALVADARARGAVVAEDEVRAWAKEAEAEAEAEATKARRGGGGRGVHHHHPDDARGGVRRNHPETTKTHPREKVGWSSVGNPRSPLAGATNMFPRGMSPAGKVVFAPDSMFPRGMSPAGKVVFASEPPGGCSGSTAGGGLAWRVASGGIRVTVTEDPKRKKKKKKKASKRRTEATGPGIESLLASSSLAS